MAEGNQLYRAVQNNGYYDALRSLWRGTGRFAWRTIVATVVF